MSKLIALDDGHGMDTAGKRTPVMDNGAVVRENEFNRAVVNYLDAELRRCGFRTVLLAPTDADTSLSERVAVANNNKADAYISIHFNAFDGRFDGNDPSGIEIHHYPGATDSKRLAECVGRYLKEGTPQKWRGVKGTDLYVLRKTSMTAILSENGFMDAREEAKLMLNADFQKEVAREHCKGICEYFGVAYVPEPVPVTPASDDRIYRVQVGAYAVRTNADNMVTRLKALGFDAIIV